MTEPMVNWSVKIRRCVMDTAVGRFESATQAAEAVLEFGTEAGLGNDNLLYYYGHQWMLQYHRGELAKIKGVFRAAAEQQSRPVLRPALAAICAEIGELDECAAVLEDVDESTFALDDQDLLVAAAVTAIAANAIGDEDRAKLAYDTLRPYENQMIDNASTHFGSAQHYLGLAAAALTRPEEAIERLGTASGIHQAGGLGPLASRSKVEAARIQASQPGSAIEVEEALGSLARLRNECDRREFGGAAAAANAALEAATRD